MTPTQPRACLMGHPVAHSRSPMLHGHWLATLGVAGSYELADLTPAAFPAFFRSLAENGFVGGNITVPHKEAAFRLVDDRDDAAARIGALNTVWFEHGRLIGINTDAPGYLAHLEASAPGWDRTGGRAIVLGAGGAARAVVYALTGRGIEVAVVNRTRARAEVLAADFGKHVSAYGFEALPGLLPDTGLLTNTTTLGMAGKDRLVLDIAPLHRDAVVYDIVYVPLETELLRDAARRGHRTVDGLGMLLHQAVPGFAHWFGVTPVVTSQLRSLLEADIRAQLTHA